MKGIVLTGGKGSRLRPFTYSGAKQLVPIGNTPVLHFPVRQLVECGITEIALVVGDTEPQIRAAMGDGAAFGARFTYVRQEAPLGLAHGLGMCQEFAAGEPVVLYLGDNVLIGGVAGFVSAFETSTAAASVVLKDVADPRAFGVAVISGERLERIIEKPAEPPSNLAVIGVYAFRPAVFDVIAGLRPSARGEYEIADAINALIAAGQAVDAAATTEHWIDTGKMEDMLAANRVVLETYPGAVSPDAKLTNVRIFGEVTVDAGAELEDCILRGPLAIGANARLSHVDVDPCTSIGPGCVVRETTIGNSIVMEDAMISDCPGITDSMIGRFAVVERAPAGARLTLGDHSCFEGPK